MFNCSLQNNNTLTCLIIDHVGLDSTACSVLSMGLSDNGSLHVLDLTGNGLVGAAGVTALSKALETNTGLREVILTNTAGGPDGGLALGKMLIKNTTLEILTLNSTLQNSSLPHPPHPPHPALPPPPPPPPVNLSEEGAAGLARGLLRNVNLRQLSVAGNQISEAGIRT
jgi:hypothetical protein